MHIGAEGLVGKQLWALCQTVQVKKQRVLLVLLISLLYKGGGLITTHTEHHLQSTQTKEECSTKESKLLTVRGHRKQG